MKEESDIPLLKSYNKDTTVIETDPFMEKEIDELIRAYAQPQEIVRTHRGSAKNMKYTEKKIPIVAAKENKENTTNETIKGIERRNSAFSSSLSFWICFNISQ